MSEQLLSDFLLYQALCSERSISDNSYNYNLFEENVLNWYTF